MLMVPGTDAPNPKINRIFRRFDENYSINRTPRVYEPDITVVKKISTEFFRPAQLFIFYIVYTMDYSAADGLLPPEIHHNATGNPDN
jgi:hypothetical protein